MIVAAVALVAVPTDRPPRAAGLHRLQPRALSMKEWMGRADPNNLKNVIVHAQADRIGFSTLHEENCFSRCEYLLLFEVPDDLPGTAENRRFSRNWVKVIARNCFRLDATLVVRPVFYLHPKTLQGHSVNLPRLSKAILEGVVRQRLIRISRASFCRD
jgi:hypothetical protein